MKLKVILPVLSCVLLLTPFSVCASTIVLHPESVTTRVNKTISIGSYAPSDLVALDSLAGGTGLFIRAVAFSALQTMMNDMATAHVPVELHSAYRSYDEQQQLYSDTTTANAAADDTVAQPGYSEHQLGLAVDFGAIAIKQNGFANSAQYAWLLKHAYTYGFALSYPVGKTTITGYTYEPWHWRYIGTDAARTWQKSNLALDQYVALQPQAYVDGTLVGRVVKTPSDPTVYYMNANGTKRGFINANAFLSYKLAWIDVLLVPPEQLQNIPETKVVKVQGNPTVYQFNADKTRQAITSAEAFAKAGYTWSDVVEINATELAGYKVGPIIK